MRYSMTIDLECEEDELIGVKEQIAEAVDCNVIEIHGAEEE
jgi:hypothetical protein